jgi:hypothetical protein
MTKTSNLPRITLPYSPFEFVVADATAAHGEEDGKRGEICGP